MVIRLHFGADAERAKTLLGWEVAYTVEDMCQNLCNFAPKA
jgi:UDP-glucose 4-epimerase